MGNFNPNFPGFQTYSRLGFQLGRLRPDHLVPATLMLDSGLVLVKNRHGNLCRAEVHRVSRSEDDSDDNPQLEVRQLKMAETKLSEITLGFYCKVETLVLRTFKMRLVSFEIFRFITTNFWLKALKEIQPLTYFFDRNLQQFSFLSNQPIAFPHRWGWNSDEPTKKLHRLEGSRSNFWKANPAPCCQCGYRWHPTKRFIFTPTGRLIMVYQDSQIFWQKTRLSKHLSFNFKDIY